MDITSIGSEEEIKRRIRENKPGGIYVHNMSPEKVKEYAAYANSICKYPVLVTADVENGPGAVYFEQESLPHPMAWGACDDEALIERAGELTAQIMRKRGVNFTLAPIADINLNFNNPVINIRSISDSPKQVAKMAAAYMRGLQKNGMLMATAKHFPGDGVDDRNQHFCATYNSLSKEEWDATFGYVYKKLIDGGIASVMAAHIGLDAYEEEPYDSCFGAYPSVLSKSLLTGLLKEKLGFDGCVISDAMSMIGAVSLKPIDELAARFICAGGDMVLFPEKRDLQNLMDALKSGFLSRERLLDAVRRIIELKKRARLFEEESEVMKDIEDNPEEKIREISLQIAEKSVKIVRDYQKILPLKLEKGAKILLINLYKDKFKELDDANVQLLTMEEEFRKRGYEVDVYHRITHRQLYEIMNDYAAVFVNSKISSTDYYGAGLRIGWWDGIMTFWRGYAMQHPRLIYVSYGDPYKLYEMPFLKTYINAFSNTESSQKAVVKLVLGEIEEKAKNPVRLEGFFEREVE